MRGEAQFVLLQGGMFCNITKSNNQRIYNDKAESYPHHVGKLFNFRIFFFIFHSWSKENIKDLGIGAIYEGCP